MKRECEHYVLSEVGDEIECACGRKAKVSDIAGFSRLQGYAHTGTPAQFYSDALRYFSQHNKQVANHKCTNLSFFRDKFKNAMYCQCNGCGREVSFGELDRFAQGLGIENYRSKQNRVLAAIEYFARHKQAVLQPSQSAIANNVVRNETTVPWQWTVGKTYIARNGREWECTNLQVAVVHLRTPDGLDHMCVDPTTGKAVLGETQNDIVRVKQEEPKHEAAADLRDINTPDNRRPRVSLRTDAQDAHERAVLRLRQHKLARWGRAEHVRWEEDE